MSIDVSSFGFDDFQKCIVIAKKRENNIHSKTSLVQANWGRLYLELQKTQSTRRNS